MTPLPTGRTMWLSSSEHPSWGRPRRVRFRRLLHGPDTRRQYALLYVDPDSETDGQDTPSTTRIVVTPRFERELTDPGLGRPLHVHVWLIADEAQLDGDQFQPIRPNADAWCTLYAHRQEALDQQVAPW